MVWAGAPADDHHGVSSPAAHLTADGTPGPPPDHGETHGKLTGGEHSALLVLGALRVATRGLRLSEMAAVTAMPVGQIGTALLTLERRGEAQFVGGRWTATPGSRA
jgi:hypothetical protein